MKRLAALLITALAMAAHAQSHRFPPIDLYTGDPTGVACSVENSLVQSSTNGSVYSCHGGVYSSSASAGAAGLDTQVQRNCSGKFCGSLATLDAAGNLLAIISDKGGQVLNVRALGAKCDGSTDDHVAIQAALDTVGRNKVLIPAGFTCLSSTGLVIKGDNGTVNRTNSLEVDGTLKLSASISTPFLSIGTTTSWIKNISILGVGTIDANYNAPVAISGVNYTSVPISVAQVNNATLFGIVGGDTTAVCTAPHCYHAQMDIQNGTSIQLEDMTRPGSGTWGNCSTSITLPAPLAALTNAAAGICMDAGTDNTIDEHVYTINYPVGASIHAGDNRIHFHPWGANFSTVTGVLQIGVDDYASGTNISNAYIDTPQAFGVWEHGFGAIIDNTEFFLLSGYAPDNVAIGVYYSQAQPFSDLTNNRFYTTSSGTRWAMDVYSSDFTNITMVGNNVDAGTVISNGLYGNLKNLSLHNALTFKNTTSSLWSMSNGGGNNLNTFDFTAAMNRIAMTQNGGVIFNNPANNGYTFTIGGLGILGVFPTYVVAQNNDDAAFQSKLSCGATVTQSCSYALQDMGVTKWYITKDVTNNFQLFDTTANGLRMSLVPNGASTYAVTSGNSHVFTVNGGAVGTFSGSGFSTTGLTSTSPNAITTANCLAAATVNTPCVAYQGSFTGLGVSGTTGVQTLYTTNAPAGAVVQICPSVFIGTAGTAGTINMQATYTTPGGQSRSTSTIGPTANLTGSGLALASCTTLALGTASSFSFAVLTVSGTGTPVWETEPVVLRIH